MPIIKGQHLSPKTEFKKGRKLTIEEIQKLKIALKGINKAEKNGMWKDIDVGINSLHRWIERRIPKPRACNKCKKQGFLDLTNKGIYNRDLKNWEWLCRRCHMLSDGRMKNLNRNMRLKNIACPVCKISFHPKTSKTKYCSHKCANIGRHT